MESSFAKAARLAIAIFLTLPLCATAQNSVTDSAEATEAEYEIFSTYMSHSFVGAVGEDRVGDPVSQIVIVNRTESDKEDLVDDDMQPPGGIEKYLRKEMPLLRVATISNFRFANSKQAQLAARFHLPLQYQLVPAEKIGSILNDVSSWPEYYKHYPGAQGYVAFSRVGFSPDVKQALFYAVNRCGGKCATGSYVIIEKRGSAWKIVKELFIWVS